MLLLTLTGCAAANSTPTTSATRTSTGQQADVVTQSISDVERFWTDQFPKISGGAPFQKITGGYHPYTETVLPPACGDQPSQYVENAFYCPANDSISWDAQNLIPNLQKQFGPLLVGVVIAHEYGHAIQQRLNALGDQTPTVVSEQQADCYAGAWLADALAGNSSAFHKITAADLDNTVGGILTLRDQPGSSALAPQAHGNAFDRVRALQDGVEQGVTICAKYDTNNLPVTEVPFSDQQDADTGGNLPYADAVNQLTASAQQYWAQAYPALTGQQWKQLSVQGFGPAQVPACSNPDASVKDAAFYCPQGDFVAFDTQRLGPQLYQIGDNAVGMLLGELFARAVQDRRGISTQDKAGQLAVDCLAGSWTNDLLTGSDSAAQVKLSPGDLDEAVTALLATGRTDAGSGGTAFDRISAYRKGVLNGLSACQS